MTMPLSRTIDHSLPTEICARVYHAIAAGTEIIHTIAKIVKVAIAGLLAGLTLGRSNRLNSHTFLNWNDAHFSMQMVALSIRGIFDPATVVEMKHQANGDYWEQRTVVYEYVHFKEENRIVTYWDKFTNNILYCSDFVEAGIGASMALVRSITAAGLYPIEGGRSQILPEIFMLQVASVGFHLLCMGVAAVGTVRHEDVLKMQMN